MRATGVYRPAPVRCHADVIRALRTLRLHQLRRSRLHHEQSQRVGWADVGRREMGLCRAACRQLDSYILDHAHAGCAGLWQTCRRTAHRKCGDSRTQRGASLLASLASNGLLMAQRFCSCAVCFASAAGGIGCLGLRTPRRPERLFCPAYAHCIREVCEE